MKKSDYIEIKMGSIPIVMDEVWWNVFGEIPSNDRSDLLLKVSYFTIMSLENIIKQDSGR